MRKFKLYSLVLIFASLCFSCSENSDSSLNNLPTELDGLTIGSGFFEYSDHEPLNGRVMRIFYHIPENFNLNTPILFVFHGNGRNAKDYRDAMVNTSEDYGFITITPEFSVDNFPGGDQYNLGNVFIDGDNPSPSTLNNDEDWTFSIIEPLFDYVKNATNNANTTYNIFGHSAGGQFAHRFLQFKPNARINKVVASASGWYTVTDTEIRFPYGYMDSPLETLDVSDLLSKKLIIQIGSQDNNPNSSGLRHNQFADAQGLNRLVRAQHFFNKALDLSNNNNYIFNWELYINEGADHDYLEASQSAADLIFN